MAKEQHQIQKLFNDTTIKKLARYAGAIRVSNSIINISNEAADDFLEYFLRKTNNHAIHHDDLVNIWDDFNGKGSYKKLIESFKIPPYSGGIIKPYSRRGKRINEILKDDISKTNYEIVRLRFLRSTQYIFEDAVLEKLSNRQIQISESALVTLQLFIEISMLCLFKTAVKNSNKTTLTEKDILDVKLTLNQHFFNMI